MALTKRVEVLIGSDEYAALKSIAVSRQQSVGALIRDAAREKYLDTDRRKRIRAMGRVTSTNLDLGDWEEVKQEIEEGRYQDLTGSIDGGVAEGLSLTPEPTTRDSSRRCAMKPECGGFRQR